ncbi:MAG: M14 family zinc carboxypeptidase [Calditrichota bacterium]
MRNYLQLMVIILCLLPGILCADWRPDEMKVKVELNEPSDLDKIRSLGISPVAKALPMVYLHLIPTELKKLREAGFRPQILIHSLNDHSSDILNQPHLAGYSDYEATRSKLYKLQKEYSNILRVSVIGKSVADRDIFAVKISDNPSLAEDEPKVAFDGGFHGDEINTTELLVMFIEDLCRSYGNDNRIRDLIHSREIYVLPLINPDGRSTLTRRNANNVDLNRDWGYFWDGSGNSDYPYSQPESRALLKWVFQKSASIHQSLHSGAELISYPWSYHPESVPEADLFDYLSSGRSRIAG